MSAVNFSSEGVRWRVILISSETQSSEYVPRVPGTGLLFTSNEADMRFLALGADAVPTPEYLRQKSVAELAALVQLAQPLAR
jgi:hypothetical protein